MPPGLLYVVVASVGALALGIGAVATIDGHPLGIVLALAHAFRPGLVRTEHVNVEVELESELCRGRTVVDRWHRTEREPNADVAVEVEGDAFLGLLLERIGGLG